MEPEVEAEIDLELKLELEFAVELCSEVAGEVVPEMENALRLHDRNGDNLPWDEADCELCLKGLWGLGKARTGGADWSGGLGGHKLQ